MHKRSPHPPPPARLELKIVQYIVHINIRSPRAPPPHNIGAKKASKQFYGLSLNIKSKKAGFKVVPWNWIEKLEELNELKEFKKKTSKAKCICFVY